MVKCDNWCAMLREITERNKRLSHCQYLMFSSESLTCERDKQSKKKQANKKYSLILSIPDIINKTPLYSRFI